MTERRNDNAAFARLAARRRQERADKLTLAKREAAERGKQFFELDKLEKLYDTHSPGGFREARELRELDYEYRYYVDYAETMNLAEYAAKQQAHDAGTDPRPPRGPAQLAARANMVLGVEISSAAEVAELVRRQLEGGGVWSDRADYNEVDGLRRAMLDAGPLAAAFGEALLNLLGHADLRVRTGAVAFIGDAVGHVRADDVVGVLQRSPTLFRGVAPTQGLRVQAVDLEAALATAIGGLVRPSDARATSFLRDYLVASSSVPVLLGLAEVAPDWVVANAATAVPRAAIGGVLRKLPERSQRRAMLQALAPWPADEGRAVVAKSFWNTLPISDDERAELKRIIATE